MFDLMQDHLTSLALFNGLGLKNNCQKMINLCSLSLPVEFKYCLRNILFKRLGIIIVKKNYYKLSMILTETVIIIINYKYFLLIYRCSFYFGRRSSSGNTQNSLIVIWIPLSSLRIHIIWYDTYFKGFSNII
jgi:hypothetical protein